MSEDTDYDVAWLLSCCYITDYQNHRCSLLLHASWP